MIEVKNLTVRYPDGRTALDDISFSVGDGERAALIGANGAGKTTMLLSMAGLIDFSGKISVAGIELSKETADAVRQKTGVIFQNPDDQLFMPRIYDDIAFGLVNAGVPVEEQKRRVDECMSRFGIEKLRDSVSMRLSGGEKRMASLAAVMIMQPEVLLMDEPTAFLDPRARRTLINLINSLSETCLIATHDMKFACDTCSRAIIIKDGKMFADGKTDELLYDAALMEACGLEAID